MGASTSTSLAVEDSLDSVGWVLEGVLLALVAGLGSLGNLALITLFTLRRHKIRTFHRCDLIHSK